MNKVPTRGQTDPGLEYADRLNTLWDIERVYGSTYPKEQRRKVREAINEWRKEEQDLWRERHGEYCRGKLREFETMKTEMLTDYEAMKRAGEPFERRELRIMHLDEVNALIKRYKAHLRALEHNGEQDSITPEMIDRAREYPIENLVTVNRRGYARCVAHEDNNPSMFTRGNFGHCFSCGYTGDTIDILMKAEGLSFPDAVKRLQ